MPSTTRRRFMQQTVTAAGIALLWRPGQAIAETLPCLDCARPCETVCPDGVRIAATLSGDPRVPERRRQSVLCGECILCADACPADLPVVELLLNR